MRNKPNALLKNKCRDVLPQYYSYRPLRANCATNSRNGINKWFFRRLAILIAFTLILALTTISVFLCAPSACAAKANAVDITDAITQSAGSSQSLYAINMQAQSAGSTQALQLTSTPEDRGSSSSSATKCAVIDSIDSNASIDSTNITATVKKTHNAIADSTSSTSLGSTTSTTKRSITQSASSTTTKSSSQTTTGAKSNNDTGDDSNSGNDVSSDDYLTLDNNNVYKGMSTAYKKGYMPAISKNKVTIYLPLLPLGDITGKKITVTPDFGDAAASPFVFSNVQKTVTLAEHTLTNGRKSLAYLVVFDLSLLSSRVNGRYPLTFNVKYATPEGQKEQSFTIYVTVKDGTDPNAKEPEPKAEAPEKPSSQPKLIISEYQSRPAPALAGSEFQLHATLRNTSSAQSVKNITLTLKAQGDDIIPSESDSTQYIASISKDSSSELTFSLRVRADAKPQVQKLTLDIEYEDNKATALTSSAEMLIEIKQPLRLEVDKPNIPAQLNAGDTIPISLGVFNMGRGPLSNVLLELEAPGLIPQGTVFLGSLEAGDGKTAEFTVFVGTKDMTGAEASVSTADAEKYGPVEGKIKITYEDEFGEKFEKEVELRSQINPPFIPETTPTVEAQEKSTVSEWWISVLIAAALILLGFAIMYALRRRRQRYEAVDEDED